MHSVVLYIIKLTSYHIAAQREKRRKKEIEKKIELRDLV